MNYYKNKYILSLIIKSTTFLLCSYSIIITVMFIISDLVETISDYRSPYVAYNSSMSILINILLSLNVVFNFIYCQTNLSKLLKSYKLTKYYKPDEFNNKPLFQKIHKILSNRIIFVVNTAFFVFFLIFDFVCGLTILLLSQTALYFYNSLIVGIFNIYSTIYVYTLIVKKLKNNDSEYYDRASKR